MCWHQQVPEKFLDCYSLDDKEVKTKLFSHNCVFGWHSEPRDEPGIHQLHYVSLHSLLTCYSLHVCCGALSHSKSHRPLSLPLSPSLPFLSLSLVHSTFPLSPIPLILSRPTGTLWASFFFTRVLDMSHFALLKDQTDWTADCEMWYVMAIMWNILKL